jgi:hypothetical protein
VRRHSGCFVDRGADGGGDGEDTAFARALRAVGAGAVGVLDQDGLEFERGVLDRRDAIVQRA